MLLLFCALVFSCSTTSCWASNQTTGSTLNPDVVVNDSSTIDDLNFSSTAVLSTSGESSFNNETDYGGEYEDPDSGKVAGIVVGIVGALALAGAVVAFCVYKQYVRRNVKSMNFDNPVYRKTTEDQFSLEKNQYQPTRSYPATLEPLTNPGTNEFV